MNPEQNEAATALADRLYPDVSRWEDLQVGDRVSVEGPGWAQTFQVKSLDDGKGRVVLRIHSTPRRGMRWNLHRVSYGTSVRIAGRLYGTVAGSTRSSIKVRPAGKAE